jgi:hypothetical protein
MEALNPRYILTRAIFLIAALVAVLYGVSYVKKFQRRAAIVTELTSIASDGSFFQQFYAEEAGKSLVRAVGLIAEANTLGVPPDKAINQALGIKTKYFTTDEDRDEPPPRQTIVRNRLSANYQNFLKLGYKPDFHTLGAMREGRLPPIPDGPESGKSPVVATLIDAEISPGIEKVVANLEIRPPSSEGKPLSDIETAAAKQLARDLADAKVIEEPVRDRILAKLSEGAKAKEPDKEKK